MLSTYFSKSPEMVAVPILPSLFCHFAIIFGGYASLNPPYQLLFLNKYFLTNKGNKMKIAKRAVRPLWVVHGIPFRRLAKLWRNKLTGRALFYFSGK